MRNDNDDARVVVVVVDETVKKKKHVKDFGVSHEQKRSVAAADGTVWKG